MNGIIDSTGQKGVAVESRQLAAMVVPCVAAISLVTLTFFNLDEASVPTTVPSNPPILDLMSGKILDRVGGEVAPTVSSREEARVPVHSIMHFAYGVDLTDGASTAAGAVPQDGGPTIKVAAQDAATQVNPASRTKQRPAKEIVALTAPSVNTLVTSAAPMPPRRPTPVASPLRVAAQDAEPEEPTSLLARVLPSGLLPSGKEAWNKVASLGETLADRLIR